MSEVQGADGNQGGGGVPEGAIASQAGSDSFLASVAAEAGQAGSQPNGAELKASEAVEGAIKEVQDGPPEGVPAKFWDAENKRVMVEELAKSYTNLEHHLGKEKVPVPADDDDEEGWERWYAVTRPESEDAYEFSAGETDLPQGMQYDTELEQSFKNTAYAAGLSRKQAQVLHEKFFKLQTERFDQYQKMREQERNRLQHDLQREHGARYNEVKDHAKTVMGKYSDPDFVQWLDESGLGDDPRMIRFMDRVGRDLRGDTRLVGRPQNQGEPEDIRAALSAYEEKNHKALFDREHPRHKEAVAGRAKLFEALYGDTPA